MPDIRTAWARNETRIEWAAFLVCGAIGTIGYWVTGLRAYAGVGYVAWAALLLRDARLEGDAGRHTNRRVRRVGAMILLVLAFGLTR